MCWFTFFLPWLHWHHLPNTPIPSVGNLCPEEQKKLQFGALWRSFTTARPPPLLELSGPTLDGSHSVGCSTFRTEQSALNLTQTEPLEMMDGRHRRDVWEVCVTSWVHRAPVLSTIQSVFEGAQRHTALEDPLRRAGFVISGFFPGKNQWLDTSPPKPVALLLQWGVWCSLMYSNSNGKCSIQWNGPTARPRLELLLWWWIL